MKKATVTLLVLLVILASPLFAQNNPTVSLPSSAGVTGTNSLLGQTDLVLTADANRTLVPAEWWAGTLNVTATATLTAPRQIVAPLNKGQKYTVINGTAQTLIVGGASGAVVSVVAGATVSVVCNGTNYVAGAAGAGALPGGSSTITAKAGQLQTAALPQTFNYGVYGFGASLTQGFGNSGPHTTRPYPFWYNTLWYDMQGSQQYGAPNNFAQAGNTAADVTDTVFANAPLVLPQGNPLMIDGGDEWLNSFENVGDNVVRTQMFGYATQTRLATLNGAVILAGGSACTHSAGWTADTTYANTPGLTSSTAGATITCQVPFSSAGSFATWARFFPSTAGVFNVKIDGTLATETFSGATTQSLSGSSFYNKSQAVIGGRYVGVPEAIHSVVITVVSGSVSFLGIAPAPGVNASAGGAPAVAVGGTPFAAGNINSYSISSGVITFATSQLYGGFATGNQVTLGGFTNSQWLNGLTTTIYSAGGTSFQILTTRPDASSVTEVGTALAAEPQLTAFDNGQRALVNRLYLDGYNSTFVDTRACIEPYQDYLLAPLNGWLPSSPSPTPGHWNDGGHNHEAKCFEGALGLTQPTILPTDLQPTTLEAKTQVTSPTFVSNTDQTGAYAAGGYKTMNSAGSVWLRQGTGDGNFAENWTGGGDIYYNDTGRTSYHSGPQVWNGAGSVLGTPSNPVTLNAPKLQGPQPLSSGATCVAGTTWTAEDPLVSVWYLYYCQASGTILRAPLTVFDGTQALYLPGPVAIGTPGAGNNGTLVFIPGSSGSASSYLFVSAQGPTGPGVEFCANGGLSVGYGIITACPTDGTIFSVSNNLRVDAGGDITSMGNLNSTGSLTASGSVFATSIFGSSGVVGGTVSATISTAATSSANHASGTQAWNGTFWTGSASAQDSWSSINNLGSGANPTSTLTFAHTGSSGQASVAFPSINVNALNSTSSTSNDVAGELTLSSGTANYTFIQSHTAHPICTANDSTALAPVKVSYSNSGLIWTLTVTGTASDVVDYVCVGRP